MKKIIVVILMFVALWPSVFSVYAENKESIALPIVMYHHISKRPETWNNYVVSLEEFRSDMEYLKNNGWESISVAELLAWQRGEFTMPPKPMMISFDDGFASLTEYAEPILKEMGFKGVAALIGSACEEFSESGEFDPEWSNLSWEEAREMVERGVLEAQCHSWDLHAKEWTVGCDRRYGESIEDYRRRLSTDLSKFLSRSRAHGLELTYSIAYPFGEFEDSTTDIVRDMGFSAAFTCTEEINHLTGELDELYYLGRFNRPHGITSEKFFKKWENNY